MENNLPNLIAHYQEKFDKYVFRPTSFRCGNCGLNCDIAHPSYCKCEHPKIDIEGRAKSFLAEIIPEAITQAFLATKVEGRCDGGKGCKCGEGRSADLNDGFNVALTEVETRKADFLAGK